jgi:hypothetical protein
VIQTAGRKLTSADDVAENIAAQSGKPLFLTNFLKSCRSQNTVSKA